MKKILTLLLAFSYLLGYSQIGDSTIVVLAKKRGVDLATVTNFSSGIANDSMFGFIKSGQKLQIKNLNRKSFGTQELGIYADTTNQSYQITKAVNHTKVKRLRFANDDGGIVKISGTQSFNNKSISFEDGVILSSMNAKDTIDYVTIYADLDQQIFDSTIVIGNNVKFAGGVVSIAWWGAVPGASCRRQMQRAFDVSVRSKVWIPYGTFSSDSTLTINKNLDIEGGTLRALFNDKPLVYISGDGGGSVNRRTYNFSVQASSQTPTSTEWANTNFTGIVFRNFNVIDIKMISTIGFYRGMLMIGDNAGAAYSKNIELGYFQNNKIGLELNQLGSGFANELSFVGGRFWCNSSLLTGTPRIGVYIGNESSYLNNSITFDNPSIELADDSAIAFVFKDAKNVWVNRSRDEGNGTTAVKFLGNTENCIVTGSYNSGSARGVDSSSGGNNRFYRDAQLITREVDAYPVYQWSAVDASNEYSTGSPTLKNIAIINSSGTELTSSSNLEIYPEYAELKNSNIGLSVRYVDVSGNKGYIIKQKTETGYDGRIGFAFFDSSGNNLGSGVKPQSPSGFSWDSNWGGIWRRTSTTSADIWIIAPANAVRMQVVFTWQSGNRFRLKGFSIHLLSPSTRGTLVVPSYINKVNSVAIEQPTSMGTYEAGKVIYKANTTSNSVYAWLVEQSGTLDGRSTTGSITSGTNRLILSSGHGFRVGEYADVSGTRFKIVDFAGDTAILLSNSGSTYASISITNYDPTFKTLVTVPSGGSTDYVLAKNSGTDYDLKWKIDQSGSGTGVDTIYRSSADSITVVKGADSWKIYIKSNSTISYDSITGKPSLYFTNPNTSDTNLVKLNDSTYLFKSTIGPDTSAVRHTDSTVNILLSSGTYTPTMTGITNVASTSTASLFYMRVGDYVKVTGTLSLTPTAGSSTTTSFRFSVPIASTATDTNNTSRGGLTAWDPTLTNSRAGHGVGWQSSSIYCSFSSTTTGAVVFNVDVTYKLVP